MQQKTQIRLVKDSEFENKHDVSRSPPFVINMYVCFGTSWKSQFVKD